MSNNLFYKIIGWWRNLGNGSINRQIFGAIVTVAFGTSVVKMVAFLKELVVAWRFGLGDELDAFLIALIVPEFLNMVIAGAFSVALIPAYIKVREQEGAEAAQKLLSGAVTWAIGLLGLMTVVILVAAPFYLPVLASGFNPEKIALTNRLLYCVVPIVMLGGVGIIWSSVLNAGERFALAALSPMTTPIATIILLIAAKPLGVFALAIGLILGQVLELILLGISLHRQGISLYPRWYGFDPHMRQVTNQYVAIMSGSFLMCCTGLVDQSMAAMLPSGSVSALNYGYKVTAFPVTLITSALSTAVIPYYSKMIAVQDWSGVKQTLHRYIKLISAFAVPATVLLVLFSDKIIQILFQRGSFVASNTQVVAQVQSMYALQIPFRGTGVLSGKLLSAAQANHLLVVGSSGNLFLNIMLNYVFMQWWGVAGIALSTSCVYLFSSTLLFLFSRQIIRKHL